MDWVVAAAVRGEWGVIEIERTGLRMHDHVLEDRAKALRGCMDLGFGLGRQTDHLGIAAAFEVEDGGIRPAMFVVADQRARGIGGQGGLAGSRKTEEDRGVAIGSDRSEEHTSE